MFIRSLLFGFLILLTLNLFGQNSIESELIKQGIEMQEKGLIPEALNKFNQAIDLNPKSSEAYYYCSLNYYAQAKYSKCSDMALLSIKQKTGFYIESVLLLCSSNDKMGISIRSLPELQKAIKKNPDNSELRMRLGEVYFINKQYLEAEKLLKEAIDINSSLPEYHLFMANIMLVRGEKIKTMLALYYYLLISQNSPESERAYDLLTKLWSNSVDEGNDRTMITARAGFDIYRLSELSISVLPDTPVGKNKLEVFIFQTNHFNSILASSDWSKTDFWVRHYIQMFNSINNKGYNSSYGCFISGCKYKPEVLVWISGHMNEFIKFSQWMEKQ